MERKGEGDSKGILLILQLFRAWERGNAMYGYETINSYALRVLTYMNDFQDKIVCIFLPFVQY